MKQISVSHNFLFNWLVQMAVRFVMNEWLLMLAIIVPKVKYYQEILSWLDTKRIIIIIIARHQTEDSIKSIKQKLIQLKQTDLKSFFTTTCAFHSRHP